MRIFCSSNKRPRKRGKTNHFDKEGRKKWSSQKWPPRSWRNRFVFSWPIRKKMCLQCNLFIFLVGRELQTLHSLRRMFVNDLRARVRRAQVTSFQVILNQWLTRKLISKTRLGWFRNRCRWRIICPETSNWFPRIKLEPTDHCPQATCPWQCWS